jgi:hypothetical protein
MGALEIHDGDMFEVIDFSDKSYGIMQVRTGMVAGANGKPFSYKVRAAAWLKCQEMNEKVRAAKADPERLNAALEAKFKENE